jgi:hypothetical protein
MLSRARENEELLRLYLTVLDTQEVVLPGGFLVRGRPASDRGTRVEKLAPESLYEQLVLPVEERESRDRA